MCITDANRQEREWGISDHIFPLDIHSLQLCFSSLWLELITAASPVLHEREESWRYLSVVVQNKMRKWGKEDRIAFRGQWMQSEQSLYLLKKYESVLYVVPPEINNINWSVPWDVQCTCRMERKAYKKPLFYGVSAQEVFWYICKFNPIRFIY